MLRAAGAKQDGQGRQEREFVINQKSRWPSARLEHLGIGVICIADGYDSNASKSVRKSLRLMKGMINEAYLDQLAADTHRGLQGHMINGFSGGGRAYGYTSEPIVDASRRDRYNKPTIVGYKRKVDEAQRSVVVDIFSMYADGMYPKAIASKLNAPGGPPSPAPRGGGGRTGAMVR